MCMKRICCYCEKWESGGIESFLLQMLMHMDLSELEVDIVAAELCDSVFTRKLQAKGVTFRQLSGRQQNLLCNHRMFRRLLKERQYDVVHVHAFQGLSLYYLHLAKQAGVSVRIAHSHNSALRKSFGHRIKLRLSKWGGSRFAAAATDLWACSTPAAEFLFPDELRRERGWRFIPNGIATARFRFDLTVRQEERQRLGIENAFVVGHVGRLCYQKNQDFLLDVFALLRQRRPDSRLLLIGAGEDLAMLREKAAQLQIADAVIFYGVTDKIERLLWAMDVFAFPSRFEGLSIAAVEAQATGLPIICSTDISAETAVSDRAVFLPLEAGCEPWADAICTAVQENRASYADTVRQAGFDLADVTELIFTSYRGVR